MNWEPCSNCHVATVRKRLGADLVGTKSPNVSILTSLAPSSPLMRGTNYRRNESDVDHHGTR